LSVFHVGGDEIASGALSDSPKCADFLASPLAAQYGITDTSELTSYFFVRVAEITSERGLGLAAWEDGLIKRDDESNDVIIPRDDLQNSNVYGHAWDNIWEFGSSDRAYRLANNGYGVVYNMATHCYFDMPYEPDPAERGYYWAPRFTDTRKTFGFMPDDVYGNADFTRFGVPITKDEIVNEVEVKELEQPQNVRGLQASLWAETVRTNEQFQGMVFPRLLSVAERAWHKATWEADDLAGIARDEEALVVDYNRFANILGQRHLADLEARGIQFNLPTPGALVEGGKLIANSPFPGLAIEYSTDNGASWVTYQDSDPPAASGGEQVRTVSGDRVSRISTVAAPTESSDDDLSAGVIAGIVIGSIAGVALIGGAAAFALNKPTGTEKDYQNMAGSKDASAV